MPNYRQNKPEADVLMNSMRSMGYTFEAAISDIIDNSISADAHNIQLFFPCDPADCFIAICDDGHGMNSEELFQAMRYGSNIPGTERSENDLGRFGLGLKSASFSQCRKLTVISKKDDAVSAYSWDLDYIENNRDEGWSLAEFTDDEIMNLRQLSWLDNLTSGTVVLWEHFDLIEKSSGNVFEELNKLADSTCNYITLIFHRFLNRTENKVHIRMNHYEITGLDPFLTEHKKTNPRRLMKIPVTASDGREYLVSVQPYVLPFQKDMSKEDIEKIGGMENYRTMQGFYIYRNERLIIWGTWFGRQKGELTKHARVMVNIPNTLDDIWGIDIKKQNASIPKILKHQLKKAVDEAMDISIRTQTHRGRINKVDDNIDYIWDRIQERGNMYSYRINRDSKIFDLIKENTDDATWARIDMVLEEIENSVPYQQIYIDKSQNQVVEEHDETRKSEIKAKAIILIDMAMAMGNISRQDFIDNLFRSEPFSTCMEIKTELLEDK